MPELPLPDQPSSAEPVAPNLPDTHEPQHTPAPGGKGPLVLAPGQRPVPDYQLLMRLGGGGFGEVWKAAGPGGIEVALKFVRLDAKTGAFEQRALDVLKNIRHANLLDVYGAWQREGMLIFAMQLGDKTLYDRLHETQQAGQAGIPFEELLDYLRDAARGLDHLNGLGIQHRDVKPHNLLLVGGGVKVADFGLAKVMHGAVTSNTGALTIAYAPPEFFNGQTSQHSDQYSLAVTYCQLRGGRMPFEGPPTAIMAGHVVHPPDLTMLPETERPTVARALAKKPEERWPNCRAFVEVLAAATSGLLGSPTLRPGKVAGLSGGAGRFARPNRQATMPVPPAGPLVGIPVPSRSRAAPKPEASQPARALPAGKPPAPRPGKPGTDRTSADVPVGGESAAQEPPLGFKVWAIGGAALAALLVLGAILWFSLKSGKPGGAQTTKEPEKEITNTLGMRFVLIPAGKFRMGSPDDDKEASHNEQPQHDVEIRQSFYLGKHEVTRGQFRRFVDATNHKTKAETDGGWGYNKEKRQWEGGKEYTWRNAGYDQTDEHPVANVTWNDAQKFCAWLSEQEGKKYRLPTEAEWEYSCRARTTTRYHNGDDAESLAEFANVADASAKEVFTDWNTIKAKDGYVFTAPVGSFKPNGFGLFDMHGNVWEWCEVWYDDKYYKASPSPDPPGPAAGSFRVFRGGSFFSPPRVVRAAYRPGDNPAYRDAYLGFRVVRVR